MDSFHWKPVIWLLLKDPVKLAEVLKENKATDFEVFPVMEIELVVDGLWSVLAYRLTKIVIFSPDERAFTQMLPNLTVDWAEIELLRGHER